VRGARDRRHRSRPRLLRPVHRRLGLRRIRIEELLASAEEVAAFGALLARGGVAAIPTETFYGLAADPTNEIGVGRLLALKRREADKPLLVLFAERRQLVPLGVAAPAATLDRFFAVWPAAVTVVLPLARPIPASRGALSLGVRMPAHGALRELLARVGPVTGTSLNRSGEEPCSGADEAARIAPGEIDVLVDGGQTPGGQPSTLLDATVEPPRVLRAGAFAWPPS
jgi:L-threonylcarbamoyladenylate synthase